jgi:tricorn protease
VSRTGGVASASPRAPARVFPKFSPDGKTIAYRRIRPIDAYTIPLEGGEPARLTWHPANDQVAEWYRRQIDLIRSRRAAAIQRDRFFKVPAKVDSRRCSLPTAGYCTFSSDGSQIAFVSPSYDNRTWKHYRGGDATDLDLRFRQEHLGKITDWDGPTVADVVPARSTLLRTGTRQANLWAFDVDKKISRQVTHFDDYDVKWPSIKPGTIVFEKGGNLWVMARASRPARSGSGADDKPFARARLSRHLPLVTTVDLSPSAKRAVFEARGG